MNGLLCMLALLCLASALLAERSDLATAICMLTGTVLVLGLLVAGASAQCILRAALTLCAAALFAGRKPS